MTHVHPNMPMNAKILTNLVRMFLRDQPKLNALWRKEETTDEEIGLYINMALSDWNSTPPLLNPIGIENFPAFDWLIIAASMFVLESAGVLYYRNDMPFNDNGVTTNPWGRGPNYIGLAGLWSRRVEEKKREFKYAYNVGKTFGIIKSPEYRMWDYSGLYAGAQFNDFGTGSLSAAPSMVPTMADGRPYQGVHPGHKSDPLNFRIVDWVVNPATGHYEITFHHNLNTDVDVRITDPITGVDLRNRCGIQFASKNYVLLYLPFTPDTRFEGQMIAFKL